MKNILKSLLVLALVLSLGTASSLAWFSSSVSAEDNEISTGSLMLAVDSTRTHSYSGAWGLYDAYQVAYDDNGTVVNDETLEPWTNVQPATYVAYPDYALAPGVDPEEPGNKSIWFSVRNRGTLPAKAYIDLAGAWDAASSTRLPGTPDNTLVRLRNVHLYMGGQSGNCENHEECRNIRDGLFTGPWTYAPTSMVSAAADRTYNRALDGARFYLTSDLTSTGTPIYLEPNEFVIVRMDLNLSTSTGNEYQGATYLYDVMVNGSQTVTGAPW